ncbi:uncharacterized protein LOC101846523 [Aplysia californica]|uniref:Uncharacterized protein LOC101846523 n=1 Tax=Aplysia californica TaxID=6500 RepID=A0ABM0K2C5_APLCA|nr:uncharacterized protein LOC101846523 [Aplysia californica]
MPEAPPVFDYGKVRPDTRHLKWVLPPSTRGMQATLHKDVPRILQPNVCHDADEYLAAARRILHRQRMTARMLPRFNRAKSANYATLLKEIHEAEDSQMDLVHLPKFTRSVEAYQVPVFPGRRYSPNDVMRIVDRLSTYDPEKSLQRSSPLTGPAESKGVAPVTLTEPNRTSLCKVKKCTSQEVQDIVDRLSSFDPTKWPPGSRSEARSM